MIKRALTTAEKRSNPENRSSVRRERWRCESAQDRKTSKAIKKSRKPLRKPKKSSESRKTFNSSDELDINTQNHSQRIWTTRIGGNQFNSDSKTSR